jgi:drug/metabolite transporter (DMT)-like permease
MTMGVILALATTIALNVVAQLLLKIGATRPGLGETLPFAMINLYTVTSLACFIVAVGFYASVLQRMPLIVAQSILSLQFVSIIVAAAVILGERMQGVQILGIALIAFGLFLVVR